MTALLDSDISSINLENKSPLVLDLFSGAGGLSEGFWKSDFNFISHIEADKYACDTLKTRYAYWKLKKAQKLEIYNRYLLQDINRDQLYLLAGIENSKDIINKRIADSTYDILVNEIMEKLQKEYKRNDVDVVIGGPPCQAYSVVGRSVMKQRVSLDERNYLYQYYLKFIKTFRPKIIVFENVKGLLSASNGKYYKDLIQGMKNSGYHVPDPKILNASDYGCLQNRERVILFGFNKQYFPKDIRYPILSKIDIKSFTINDLLEDLPVINNGEACNGKNKYILKSNKYLVSTGIRSNKDNILTHHVARIHNDRDLQIYDIAINKWFSESKNIKYDELPTNLKTHNNTTSFVDRFKVVKSNMNTCHTVLAHISKDGHYYIHPDRKQRRSLTVREAARIQSFPDNFYFEGPRTAVFTQIGNAVPPLMSAQIAKKVKELLNYDQG